MLIIKILKLNAKQLILEEMKYNESFQVSHILSHPNSYRVPLQGTPRSS